MKRLPAALAFLPTAFLAAGCSPGAGSNGQQQVVFAVASGFRQGGPSFTHDIIDLGLPALENVSGHSVQLTGISLAGMGPGVRIRNVTAFRRAGPAVGIEHGDMHACKGARPITAVVTRPHAHSAWQVVIAIVFTKPGLYAINHVKVSYLTDGHSGWQYQNLFTTTLVTAPPAGLKLTGDGCP